MWCLPKTIKFARILASNRQNKKANKKQSEAKRNSRRFLKFEGKRTLHRRGQIVRTIISRNY